MNTKEAAIKIGCHPRWVRELCKKGTLKCKVKPLFRFDDKGKRVQYGTTYDVDPRSVRSYAKKPQTQGYPRGRKRE